MSGIMRIALKYALETICDGMLPIYAMVWTNTYNLKLLLFMYTTMPMGWKYYELCNNIILCITYFHNYFCLIYIICNINCWIKVTRSLSHLKLPALSASHRHLSDYPTQSLLYGISLQVQMVTSRNCEDNIVQVGLLLSRVT